MTKKKENKQAQEQKDRFEFELGGKTYLSKKMQPVLRGLIYSSLDFELLEKLFSKHKQSVNDMASAFGDISMSTPPLMWEMIKDNDKTSIGTYEGFDKKNGEYQEGFLDHLYENEEQVWSFLGWCFSKLEAHKSFLDKGSAQRAKLKA